MGKDSFIVCKTEEDIYADIAKNLKTKFDTSKLKDHFLEEKLLMKFIKLHSV